VKQACAGTLLHQPAAIADFKRALDRRGAATPEPVTGIADLTPEIARTCYRAGNRRLPPGLSFKHGRDAQKS